MWIAGDGRADVIVRSENPIHHLAVTAESPIGTILTISAGAGASKIPIVPGKSIAFDVPASGVRGLNSYAYLLSAQSSEGFTPHLQDPRSGDNRNLGVLINFRATDK